ncbi:helix-turn-helix domain-containing protein [Corynebacterium terpenotabidum]|uniref:ArsR DNA-binding transcription regulator n=1 Tax=Corynebacterium terpenotabidum Y-11 TaxID=1200352 RepID=S4XH46_9CORY|nr:helix-turn-helix domain-containing protein [Corynebacterium terpenotabidum]AGP31919.1 ArsR DNA-binding transcription regulator [Corynebacterium terpenotabidum Y-11]
MTSIAAPSPRGRVLAAVGDHHARTGAAVTSAALAEDLQLHPSTVRFHLRKLVDAGQVIEKVTPAEGRGRPRKCYLPAPQTPTDSLLVALVGVLADSAEEREARAARAGRIWAADAAAAAVRQDAGQDAGQDADPLNLAATVLTALGFEIQSATSIFGTHEIRVCSCPLRLLGQQHPEVARGIQRGVVEQALATAPGVQGPWHVSARPDPRFGDCEVTLRLSRGSTHDTDNTHDTIP